MAKLAPATLFLSLIVLILATGAFSRDTNPALVSPDDLNTTSYGEIGLQAKQCVGSFGPCDKLCDEACCFDLCRSAYRDLHPRPVCEGDPKFCVCYHDCY
ncbi:unnamed protein product [Cuscuta epithymum]|uniref:Uncharacterized protein n=1 Tax=Cuscuta epithymum TaxID=186058 RepID=A0AAV0GAW4_9ASTE|nr:unnamed protein product [Cuscuta epithymum]